MSFGLALRARSIKAPRAAGGSRRGALRGWLSGRPPAPAAVTERLGRLARRMFGGALRSAGARDAAGAPAPLCELALALHPAAPPVRIALTPDGELAVHGETAGVGPGYHDDAVERIGRLVEELEYTWEAAPAPAASALLDWLAGQLRGGATAVGMPPSRTFLVDAAVLTPMGPRDAAWRDAVIAAPARGADAFAWWDRGPGRAERSRALLAMWHEVAWREPLDDAERALALGVDADLRAAHGAAPELALPWREWAELLGHLGEDDEHAAAVRARAADAAGRAAGELRIGYRRYPMEIEVAGGWTLELGGEFVGRWEEEGDRWWATDGERVVELTALTARGEEDSAALLAVAPAAHPVLARLEAGARCGRAEVSDDGDVYAVHGLMAQAPHVAILTCKGRRVDEPWALATWRSLRNAG